MEDYQAELNKVGTMIWNTYMKPRFKLDYEMPAIVAGKLNVIKRLQEQAKSVGIPLDKTVVKVHTEYPNVKYQLGLVHCGFLDERFGHYKALIGPIIIPDDLPREIFPSALTRKFAMYAARRNDLAYARESAVPLQSDSQAMGELKDFLINFTEEFAFHLPAIEACGDVMVAREIDYIKQQINTLPKSHERMKDIIKRITIDSRGYAIESMAKGQVNPDLVLNPMSLFTSENPLLKLIRSGRATLILKKHTEHSEKTDIEIVEECIREINSDYESIRKHLKFSLI